MNRWTSSARCPWPKLARSEIRLRLAATLVAIVVVQSGGPLEAQEASEPSLVLEIFALRHRAAIEALQQVDGLLTARGTVELQPSENTLVIRDTAAAVKAIVARLRDFDRPPRPIRLEIQIVRAGEPPESPSSPRLAPELERRLRELLRFETFRLLAQAGLEMHEGEPIAYEFGSDYQVRFEPGTLAEDGQLRLRDFIVARGTAEEATPLIHTNLNLALARPMVLGLAQTESSEKALMVVLTYRLVEGAAR